MSLQAELQQIKTIVDGLKSNPVARFAYTQAAFNNDDVDGVDNFSNSAEQNIPNASKTDFNPTILNKGIRGQCASLTRAALNHYFGRMSYNLNKLVQKTSALINFLSSALGKGGFRYDDQAIYSTGDICYSVNNNDVITWYKRNGTYSSGPVPLTSLYWNVLIDAASEWLQDNKAPINTTLGDDGASNTLPATTSMALTLLLQIMRNNLKYLLSNIVLKANNESPTFTGAPKVPNKIAAAVNDGTLIATEAQVYLKADIASPAFTGVPTVPSKATAASSSYPTRIATEAQVALKANTASPTLTGTPKVPSKTTAAANDGTLIATEAQIYPFWQLIKVGARYTQYPNDPTPAELGLPGTWEVWNSRVEIYGLSTSLPASGDMPAYDANSTTAITINAYRVVTHADGDKEIFQAIAAIPLDAQGKIGAFDPVKWRPLSQVSTSNYRPTFVARKSVQPSWAAADLAIRSSVSYNNSTYLISARHNLGGKFISIAGGNRPPYITGGVAPDVSRTIIGKTLSGMGYGTNTVDINRTNSAIYRDGIDADGLEYGINLNSDHLHLDSSRVVPTGPENAVRTMSAQIWRRVS